MIFPTSTGGFDAHYTGLGVLLQFYPPELFSSDIYHTIFVGCRAILVSVTIFELLRRVLLTHGAVLSRFGPKEIHVPCPNSMENKTILFLSTVRHAISNK